MTRGNGAWRKLAAISTLLAATHVWAAPDAPAVYLGLDVGVSTYQSNNESDGGMVVGYVLGYRVNQYVSVELGSHNLWGLETIVKGFFVKDNFYYPRSHEGLAAIVRTSLADKMSVYGRLGLGRTNYERTKIDAAEKSETDIPVGLGLAYDFNDHWAIRFEWTRYTKASVNTGVLGFSYAF